MNVTLQWLSRQPLRPNKIVGGSTHCVARRVVPTFTQHPVEVGSSFGKVISSTTTSSTVQSGGGSFKYKQTTGEEGFWGFTTYKAIQ